MTEEEQRSIVEQIQECDENFCQKFHEATLYALSLPFSEERDKFVRELIETGGQYIETMDRITKKFDGRTRE